MRSGQKKHKDRLAAGAPLSVSSLAIEVVAKLVARPVPIERSLRQDILDKLVAAVLSDDPAAGAALKADLTRARVSSTVLADLYIPEAARKLGQGWNEDCLTFAQVSIGTAKLQAMLREIGADWTADARAVAAKTTVLVIVPQEQQHTLGAMVLLNQLRRRGVSVCLRLAPKPEEIGALLTTRKFDGVMISLASQENVPHVSRIVGILRKSCPRGVFIALGGAAIADSHDLVARTGVDLVSNDLDLVLQTLGNASVLLGLPETV
jgi:MerR family transcriptional regulator, light-induced transcriptional regulator